MAYIPFVYFTLLLLFVWMHTKKWGIFLTVLTYVDTAAFFSILVDKLNLYGDYGCNEYALTWGSILLYCFLWTLLLYPLYRLDTIDFVFTLRKPRLYYFFCWFIVASVFLYLVSADFFSNLKEQIQLSGSDAYDLTQDSKREIYKGTGQFWLWIPMVISTAWPLTLMCWFFNQIYLKEKKLLNILLLACSFAPVLSGLSSGGRGAFVWWLVTFVTYFSFFRKAFSPIMVKRVILVLMMLLFFSLPLFIGITVSRFGTVAPTAGNYAWFSIVGYAGQMLNNFSMVLEQDNLSHFFLDRVFPLYNLLANHVIYINSEYYDVLASVYSMQVNVFVTVFGSLLMDVGVIGLILFMLLYFLIYRLFVINDIVRLDFSQCLLFALLLCIPIRGLFGYPFSGHFQSLCIVFTIVLYILFRYSFRIK